ncbi:MAG TPA: DUF3536 domain-containing protein [Herpetosiphonaceae bacterium]
MTRYICIHGHFYQPPRENPWLEAVEPQDSAEPYHDWNERITAECYGANARARILNDEHQIAAIVNNYGRISFNIGPTLLSWLEEQAPEVYAAILEADRESQERFGGHGSALAQVYNHIIMPLASRRDKQTQIRWGAADFRRRFGRAPEGMWLAETAVDLETLELLAEEGIAFTVLAPHQAARVRRIGDKQWAACAGDVDTTRAYLQKLPSGRSIKLFFYDGPISRAIAFEELLSRGDLFAGRLAAAFKPGADHPQLVHIATDGETYGHHRRYGEMALAYALNFIEERGLATLTNYGQFLELCPPECEVEIAENTSWSCFHNIERWRAHCGCNSGGRPGWTQDWRGPLRAALDWLRDELEQPYAEAASAYFADPWAARDAYIELILDRAPEQVAAWFGRHGGRGLAPAEQSRALKLLEIQRQLQLMYTSCGWFFDELSGIETVQVIAYAGRAIQLAEEALGLAVEAPFLERLALARSNLPEHSDGRQIYEQLVRPAMVTIEHVGAHYAISSLFEDYGELTRIYAYEVEREDQQIFEAGRARLMVERATITSRVTRDSARLMMGVLHFGDHNLTGGVRACAGDEDYAALLAELRPPFERADLPATLRLLDRHFPAAYSLKSLFREEQRNILRRILESTTDEAAEAYQRLYADNLQLIRFLVDLGVPLPPALRLAAEFALNTSLQRAMQAPELDAEAVGALVADAARAGVAVDPRLGYHIARRLRQCMEQWHAAPGDERQLEQCELLVGLARALPIELDLWQAQNSYFEMLRQRQEPGAGADEAGASQVFGPRFLALGRHLGVAASDEVLA